MGSKVTTKKLFVLTGIFLITCLFIYTRKEIPAQKKPPLKQYFQAIDNYTIIRHIKLEDSHLTMLKLDDYLYADYEGPNGNGVSLYIGYYYTANKAYASHSPLICYPSQGWEIDRQPSKHTINVGPHSIHYEEIITSLNEEKELVLYWYQARLHTNTQIYQNKIDMGYNKLINNDEQHAFVRISVPFNKTPHKKIEKIALDFINVFYPQFEKFISEL